MDFLSLRRPMRVHRSLRNPSNTERQTDVQMSPLHRPLIYRSALASAIIDEDESKVIELLESGDDVNEISYFLGYGEPPIVTAVKFHRYAMLPILLRYSPNINLPSDRGHTALIRVAQKDHLDSLRLLLEHRADPNKHDHSKLSAMYWAIKHQNIDAVYELLRNGADVHFPVRQQSSALHSAVIVGNLEVVRVLMEHKADVNAHDDVGDTPLFGAIRINNFDMADMLLRMGASVNMKNNDSQTPLHIAAASVHNSIDLIQLLLDHNAMVDIPDRYGSTPLVLSLRNFILRPTCSIAKSLIQHGSTLNHENTIAALEWAVITNRNLELFKLAVDAGLRLAEVPWAPDMLTSASGLRRWLYKSEKNEEKTELLDYLVFRLKNASSLYDACRTAIRAHLIRISNGASVYHKIQKLPLPELIRLYLLLEED